MKHNVMRKPFSAEPASDGSRAAARLASLQRIALALSAVHTVDQVSEVIITEGLAALGANAVCVSLFAGEGAEPITPNDGEEALGGRDTDTHASRYIDDEDVRTDLPLIVEGHALGALTVSFPPGRILAEEDHAFLTTVAQLCAQALDRALLYDEGRREVDERRRTENSLRSSEERFRNIFDAAAMPMVLATVDGKHALVNEAACEFLGYHCEEITEMHVRDLAHPDDLPLLRAALARLLSGEIANVNVEHRFMRKDGGVVWGHDIISAARDEDGTPRYLIVTIADVSERKRLEEAKAKLAREAQAAAEQQRAFVRDVLASVTDGRLRLCFEAKELPETLAPQSTAVVLTRAAGLAELRQAAVEAAKALGVTDERQNGLMAATSEAGMNAIVHAGGGEGRVYANQDRIQVRVEDHGAGISMENLPKATLEKGYTTAGTLGQGMKMILQSVDRIYLLTGAAGTTVVIEQDRIAHPLSDFYV
jgi:PAS domain S-box-containing protein